MFLGANRLRGASCHSFWMMLLLLLVEATAGFVGVAKGIVSPDQQQLFKSVLAPHSCSPNTSARSIIVTTTCTRMSPVSEDLEPPRKKSKRQIILQQGKRISLQLEHRKEELDEKARRVAKAAAAKKLLVLEEKIQHLKELAERVHKKEQEMYAKGKDRNKATNILASVANLAFWRRNRMDRKTATGQAASEIVAATVKASMKEKDKLHNQTSSSVGLESWAADAGRRIE
jgi:hypothetical protein